MTLKKETTAFDFLVDEAYGAGSMCDDAQDLCDSLQDRNRVDEFNEKAEKAFPQGATADELSGWMYSEEVLREFLGKPGENGAGSAA